MRLIYSFLFIVSFASLSLAQSPSKILSQAEKALGGKKALQSIRSVAKTGSVKRVSDGATGKYTFLASTPNLLNVSYEVAGFETETGYNGRSAWARDSRDGLRTLTGKEGVDLVAQAGFRNNLWLKAKDEKAKITPGGQASIDGHAANIVLLSTPRGTTIKLYFDAASGLLVRDEVPDGDGVDITTYSDYRMLSGVKFPFAQTVSSGGDTFEIRIEDLKVNPSVNSAEFNFPVISTEPLPDIPTLLKQVRENEDRVEQILDTYSFVQKSVRRELGKDGVLRETGSETYQMSFYRGRRIRRLIEKNGKPLSEKDQAEADRDAANQVADIEKDLAKEDARKVKQNSDGTPSGDNRRISIAEVLKASKLINPRRERFGGRDVIVFDFEPDPAFDMANAKTVLKFFGKTAGVMWIDEKDKQVARVEAVLFESYKVGGGVLAKLKKGASFTLEQQRVNDEIWLPSQADINLSVRVLLVKGIDLNQVIRSYDYRKFKTEVKDASVEGDKKP